MSDTSRAFDQYRLSDEEAAVLVVTQLWMMKRDVAADRSDKSREAKRAVQRQFRGDASSVVMKRASETQLRGRGIKDLAGDAWPDKLTSALKPLGRAAVIPKLESDATVQRLLSSVDARDRALLLLIELHSFDPWAGKATWQKHARQASLRQVVEWMSPLKDQDNDRIQAGFDRALKQLKRRSIKWGRVAALTVGGVGLGVLTAGLAAPAIGAAVGTAMGLSGAAATSAGLAALGGGSLAAGGLGMAGGTALVMAGGGVVGVGAATATGTMTGYTGGDVIKDTLKLEVLTQLVILDEQGDDAKARMVVVAMEERLRQVERSLKKLAEQKAALSRENKDLRRENAELTEELELARAALEDAIGTLRPQVSMDPVA